MNKKTNIYIIATFVTLLVITVYLPALQNEFVNWDDEAYVLDNLHIRSLDIKSFMWAFTTFYFAYWHPLTWISYSIDYSIWGLNPMGYHLTNIILHGLNTFLVVILIQRLFCLAQAESYNLKTVLFASSLTGIIFGLHPLRVESIVWISERKDVLYAFFYLLSIHFYLSYTASESLRIKSYSLCLFSYVLSLMSKPMGITLPLILFILDYYPLRRDFKCNAFKIIREKILFVIFSLVSVILTLFSAQGSFTKEIYPLWQMLLVFIRALSFYLTKVFLPLNLAPLYPIPVKISVLQFEYIGSFILFILITVVFFKIRKKAPVFLVTWAYYVVTLLPTIGTTQAGVQLAGADRFTYLPLLGPFVLICLLTTLLYNRLSAVIQRRLINKTISLALIALLIGVLSYATIKQIRIWRNGISMWSHEIEVNPDFAKPYLHRGNAYRVLGYHYEAIKDFTEAIRLDPASNPNYYNDRGIVYANLGRFKEALRDFNIAVVLDPGNSIYRQNRENARKDLNSLEKKH